MATPDFASFPELLPTEEEVTVISFTPPAGFVAPSDIEEGAPFDASVKVRMKDGQIVLDSINGLKLAAEEMEEEDEDEMEMEDEDEMYA